MPPKWINVSKVFKVSDDIFLRIFLSGIYLIIFSPSVHANYRTLEPVYIKIKEPCFKHAYSPSKTLKYPDALELLAGLIDSDY